MLSRLFFSLPYGKIRALDGDTNNTKSELYIKIYYTTKILQDHASFDIIKRNLLHLHMIMKEVMTENLLPYRMIIWEHGNLSQSS